MDERATEPDPGTQRRMLEADAVERWSSALQANDATGVGQFVQEGHALRASIGARWIGKAPDGEPSVEAPEAGSSLSTPPVLNALVDGGGPSMVGVADDQMAVREMARGRRSIPHRPV